MASNRDVPDIDVTFLEEVDCFLQWASAISQAEQEAPEGISRWYEGEVFRAHVRFVARNDETKTCAVIRMSDIAVRPAYRGCGSFTMLVSAFNEDSHLPFDSVEISAGSNERFAAWFRRCDFEPVQISGVTVVHELLRRRFEPNAATAQSDDPLIPQTSGKRP
ncbi:hypothetical protein VSR69_43880 [Paraburkholderia phytofirmans]